MLGPSVPWATRLEALSLAQHLLLLIAGLPRVFAARRITMKGSTPKSIQSLNFLFNLPVNLESPLVPPFGSDCQHHEISQSSVKRQLSSSLPA